MTKVIVSSAAERNYTESLCWYAERSEDAAKRFDEDMNRAIKHIESDPKRYPLCDRRHRFYMMQRFPFPIIYRLMENDVTVMAVAHTSRSPSYWTNR